MIRREIRKVIEIMIAAGCMLAAFIFIVYVVL